MDFLSLGCCAKQPPSCDTTPELHLARNLAFWWVSSHPHISMLCSLFGCQHTFKVLSLKESGDENFLGFFFPVSDIFLSSIPIAVGTPVSTSIHPQTQSYFHVTQQVTSADFCESLQRTTSIRVQRVGTGSCGNNAQRGRLRKLKLAERI